MWLPWVAVGVKLVESQPNIDYGAFPANSIFQNATIGKFAKLKAHAPFGRAEDGGRSRLTI